ncbi:MAG: penicillin-binding protein 1C [Marinilabiliaceae bacterium]|nr:penicillin-binding protein 1C [Marinilabiliaceae bacterium]
MPRLLIKKYHRTVLLSLLIISGLTYWFCLPSSLFKASYSTVVTSREGDLLAAHIADDGQWRFPQADSVPYRFEQSLLLFEDEYFYSHPGFNPVSMARALWQNIRSGEIISGGSTITMQVMRLSQGRNRSVWSKLIETLQSTRLELKYSKKEILEIYASHAPFGGNVVGIDAAAWRYFGRPAHQLSWSESALLAVLPNAPSLIHPGKNRDRLLAKRNRLLQKLLAKNSIDSTEYWLSCEEPLPEKPLPLPQLAPHLLTRFMNEAPNQKHATTLDLYLQTRTTQTVSNFHSIYRYNQIHNMAALIVDNTTGEVLSYVGNTPAYEGFHGNDVDVITAPRSTGSILKPFLYAAALQDGVILPEMLLVDIPTYYTDFSPKNYTRRFDGAVPAHTALSRSLNVPAVRLLDDYGTEKFCDLLKKINLTTINRPASHYGLSLILGGAEASLWDLTGAYASMARILTTYTNNSSQYNTQSFKPPRLSTSPSHLEENFTYQQPALSASSIYFTFEALTNVQRPAEETGWENFSSGRKIAWKTGTSFGYRDAWAIGVTPEYTVAVWVGNASGEGRPGIIGGSAAAPVLFELFRSLPPTSWFETPYDELKKALICRESGFLAAPDCPHPDTSYLPALEVQSPVCPYHQLVHLSSDKKYRVNGDCYPVDEMVHQPWLVLPPVMAWYYKSKNPSYKPLPPFKPGCLQSDQSAMAIIYPKSGAELFIPVDLDGQAGRIVCKATHRHSSEHLFWHLNDEFIGETIHLHQIEIFPAKGRHLLTITDEAGNQVKRWFRCLGRGDSDI